MNMENPRTGLRCRGVNRYAVPPWFHAMGNAPKRAFISADIGAARRGLNVLARACSRAMFPLLSAAAFHLARLSLGVPKRYSPFPGM